MTLRTEVFRLNFRFRFHWFGFFVTFTDIDFDDLEVLDVGDKTISVFVNTLEHVFSNIVGTLDSEEAVGSVDELRKLLEGHHSLLSL